MRPLSCLLPVLAAAALVAGCPSRPAPPPADATPSATAPAATTATNGAAATSGAGTADVDDAGGDADAAVADENCTRPAPTPVLDASRVGNHAFSPGVGPRAVETATLDGGVRVRIEHTGCVHLVERYAFALPKETHSPADAAFWQKRAAKLLRALPVKTGRAKETTRWASILDAAKPAKPGDTIEVVEGAAWLTVSAKPTHAGSTLEIVYDVSL